MVCFGIVATVWYFLELFRQCGIFWNCSDSVVFFGIVPTVWYFLELFRQCGMFWNCCDSVVFFGIVPTVWYFLELFRQCGIFWNCSDIVVFFGIVPTVWYFLFFVLLVIINAYMLNFKCLSRLGPFWVSCFQRIDPTVYYFLVSFVSK